MTEINTNYSQTQLITEQTKQRIIGESNKIEQEDASGKFGEVKDILDLSEEGITKYKESLEKSATVGLQHNENGKGVILTDFNTMFGSRMPSVYGDKNENGEYQKNYFTTQEKLQNMRKAHDDIRSEIVSGYAAGTRETYVEDKTSEKGYRKLNLEEELDALDRAYSKYTDRYLKNNDEKVMGILKEHAQKVSSLSGGRTQIATDALKVMDSIPDGNRAAQTNDTGIKADETKTSGSSGSSSATTDTDNVDKEIEKLKAKRTRLQQELNTADESRKKELEQQLRQVEMELAQKDNDSYRRQNANVI